MDFILNDDLESIFAITDFPIINFIAGEEKRFVPKTISGKVAIGSVCCVVGYTTSPPERIRIISGGVAMITSSISQSIQIRLIGMYQRI